jgi:hypothetical protein
VGSRVGLAVGIRVGARDGCAVEGFGVGRAVVGLGDGSIEGTAVGGVLGLAVGLGDGRVVGRLVGVAPLTSATRGPAGSGDSRSVSCRISPKREYITANVMDVHNQ